MSADLRHGLLAADVWPQLVLASLLVVAGHTATFVIAARVAGSTAPLGELLALRWSDVDFGGEAIRVRRSYTAHGGMSSPKSGRVRSVPMVPVVPPRLYGLSEETFLPTIIEITRYVSLFNPAGVPCTAQPVPARGAALPASLQLVGPPRGEELLLATAQRVEAAVAGKDN